LVLVLYDVQPKPSNQFKTSNGSSDRLPTASPLLAAHYVLVNDNSIEHLRLMITCHRAELLKVLVL
jgi:hypothetical protein